MPFTQYTRYDKNNQLKFESSAILTDVRITNFKIACKNKKKSTVNEVKHENLFLIINFIKRDPDAEFIAIALTFALIIYQSIDIQQLMIVNENIKMNEVHQLT